MKKNIIKYLYSEWGDYTIGRRLISATIFFAVFPLPFFLVAIPTPIQNFNNFDNLAKKEFFVTLIYSSLTFFSILYALFYRIIKRREELISKYPIFTYILEFLYGFVACMFYLVLFMELNGNITSYSQSPIILLLLLVLSIIIILVCYYKFNNFFINFMDTNFNLRDKHWDSYDMDNKYFKYSWMFVFLMIIVCGTINVVTGNDYFSFGIVAGYVLFLYGTYLMLASISCIIYSYKERKKGKVI